MNAQRSEKPRTCPGSVTETELDLKSNRGTGIAADCVQEVLASASNASEIGQSQWHTPLAFGKLCASVLPRDRSIVTDLCAGNGALAIGASNGSTAMLLLNDIENVRTKYHEGYQKPSGSRIAADLGGIYPLCKEVDLRLDLIVLNPPWSLKWKKEAFAKLAESDVETVRRSFSESPEDTIDSTILTLMAALDLCSSRGEGFLIGNNSTLERLIFADDAPFRFLETHCWARAIVKTNIMTGEEKETWDKEKDFETGVIWWAASHDSGLTHDATTNPACANMEEFAKAVEHIGYARNRLRTGAGVSTSYHLTSGCEEKWKGVRQEWETRQGRRQADWNLWLTPSGTISTYLSLFDGKSPRIPKDEAASLFKLNGKKCIQLVTARNDRALLLHHCNGSIWRVDPKLKEAVEQALMEYYRVRAPLSPLNEIQSLGFVEESDTLDCKMDLEYAGQDLTADLELAALLGDALRAGYTPKLQQNKAFGVPPETAILDPVRGIGRPTKELFSRWKARNADIVAFVKGEELKKSPKAIFRAGKSYALRTQTVKVTRTVQRPNSMGEVHDHLYSGMELAIYIKDELGVDRLYMDKRLVELGAKIEGEKQEGATKTTCELMPDFDLQTLVKHFSIPRSPDVASCNSDGYRKNLSFMDEIEDLVNTA